MLRSKTKQWHSCCTKRQGGRQERQERAVATSGHAQLLVSSPAAGHAVCNHLCSSAYWRFGYAVLRIARLPSIIGQGRRPSVGVIARVVWFERDIDRPFNLGPASLHSGAEPDEQAQINLSSPYQPPRPCHVLSSASVAGSEDIILCYCGSRCRAFDVAFGSISNTPPYSLHLDKTVNERSTVSRARARRYTVPREPSATRATVPDLCR
jgi:hypothetical protein